MFRRFDSRVAFGSPADENLAPRIQLSLKAERQAELRFLYCQSGVRRALNFSADISLPSPETPHVSCAEAYDARSQQVD